ncbi:hypothetical protein N7495_009781 [Penicillium taxi]|uniref:uncharacterized protein n=1 Tax=Penicillium taxi TaxID=168475 RepID=UPI002544E17F|nr:uncharacterized protein N7495_009781 [Penicillium taxi]KAJ5885271.1 hypothetical protein N7495_009781 [Penicillium taxi]
MSAPQVHDLTKEDDPPMDLDTKVDQARPSARRSRRKTDTPADKQKTKKEKEDKKDKPARATPTRRPREKSTASSRKKPKLDETPKPTSGLAAPPASATSVTPIDSSPSKLPHTSTHPQPAQPATTPYSHTSQSTSPGSYLPQFPPQQSQPAQPAQQPAPVPQRTSGQNFDPIRSAFDNPSPAPAYSPSAHALSPRNNYSASASPAISSIIDRPPVGQVSQQLYTPHRSPSGHVSTALSPAAPPVAPAFTPSSLNSPAMAASLSHGTVHTPQPLARPNYLTPYAAPEQTSKQSSPLKEPSPPALQQPQQTQSQPKAQVQNQPGPLAQTETPQKPVLPSSDGAMDIDPKEQPAPSAKKEKAPAAKAAKETPRIPQGSGRISSALFGGADDNLDDSPPPVGVNIDIEVDISGGNVHVNFLRMAEEKYGFDAVHPRIAARKRHLARVIAASNALEAKAAGESLDEESADIDQDSDMDGDISMIGGKNDESSSVKEGKKKPRRKKVEEYDQDDGFIDDTELSWQAAAAASKDGFFVYSGPLVRDGETAQIERADGTVKRGRGRGRGTGRGRANAASSHVAIASATASVPISQDTGLPLRGPGSRGGTTRRARGAKKNDAGDHKRATDNNNGNTTSNNGTNGRGGSSSTRGAKSGTSSSTGSVKVDLTAPSASHTNSAPPTPSPLAGPELK